ncbi:MAG: ExeM/NucH family extracellular endonuclease [Alphaproteobacteria bacterium]
MTLQAGDIAIIGVQADTPDAFSFVALTDIPAGEEIFFTDNGVFDDGGFRLNEGIIRWVAPNDVAAGTVIAFTGVGGAFTTAGGSFALSTSGDQVFAFQGTTDNPTFLFAVQTNSTQFQVGADDAQQSALPPGLVVGETAVAVGAGAGAESEFDNSTYNGAVTSGTKEELLAAIADAANWNGSNSVISIFNGPFTVTGSGGGMPFETGTVIINEQVVSTDGLDREFVEFVGTPGQSLDGFAFLEIEDGGEIDTVIDLSGLTIGDNGFLLGTSPAAEDEFGITGNFGFNNNTFTNGSRTYLLVEGFTGQSGDDIDTDNDGTIDTIVWNAISDSAAFVDDDNPLIYSQDVVGPDGTFLAPGGFRDPEGTGDFQIHDFFNFDAYTPTVGTAAPPAPQVVINEIVVSTDSVDQEFVEFAGTPGESLDGFAFLEIENGGEIDTIIDLSGFELGVNGFLLGTSPEAEADLGVVGNFQIDNNTFTNGSRTYLLVNGFTGASGDDIDADNDGTIDNAPWAAIVDDIALIDDDNPIIYSAQIVGPDGSFLAPGAFRDPQITGAFQIHDFFSSAGYTPTAGVFPTQPLVINEIVVSTIGDDEEFFELLGEPGTSLDGVSLIEVESGGEVDSIIDLTGFSTGDNGFFLGASPEAESELGVIGNLQIGNNTFTNNSQTYLLVRDFTGAEGSDIDTDDDGVIDTILWTEIIDSVAAIEADDPIIYSANVLGPDGTFLAPGGFRDPEGTGDFLLHAFSSNAAYTPTAGTGSVGDPEPRLISEIQGEGRSSTLAGTAVLVEAVVTSVNTTGSGNLGGFFIQEEDIDADGNDLTSEGIFVFTGSNPSTTVQVGDTVRVAGTVNEFFDETQISNVTSIEVVSSGNTLPTAAVITFPVAAITTNSDGERIADLEAFEGMRVTVPQEMTVSDLFTLGRFGDIGLNSGGLTEVFTQGNAPSVDGFDAFIDEQVKQTLVLDDGSTIQNPATVPFEIAGESGAIPGQFDAADPLSAGDTVEDLTGVLRFSRGSGGFGDETYRLVPTEAPDFVDTTPREETPPDVGGTLTVAAYNVLNFFTTLDDERSRNNNPLNAGPNNLEPRGANDRNFDGAGLEPGDPGYVPDLVEFERQVDKLVAALTGIDADVLGLIEIENEFGSDQNGDGLVAIETLVSELTAATGTNYAYVDPGVPFIGTDAIAVGLIYDADAVRLAEGTTVEVLTDADLAGLGLDFGNPVFDGPGTSRSPLAATFQDIESGGTFTVAVNHYKSKGSVSPFGNNEGIGDGTGNNNEARLQASIALDTWLDTDPTGSGDPDVMILGDLNSYAMEDPITFLKQEGYGDLVDAFIDDGDFPFSFGFPVDLDIAPAAQTFGSLDYALANASLAAQVTGAAEWNISSLEASALDYNVEFKPQSQIDDLFAPSPYRASDHDPVIIGLELDSPEPDFEVVGVNDWFSEERGQGGFNVSLNVTLTDEVLNGDFVERFALDVDYDADGSSFAAGWLNGFQGPVDFDTGTGTFSTESVGFVRKREAGDVLNVNVQVQGAGFDAELLKIGFIDRDPAPVFASAEDPQDVVVEAAAPSFWGRGAVQNVDLRNTGSETVDGWAVRLDLEEGEADLISDLKAWSADTFTDGEDFYFTPLSYNASINAGESQSFGFQAGFTDTLDALPWDEDDLDLVALDDVPGFDGDMFHFV